MAGPRSSKSGRTALGGVLAAGSLAFLWGASLTPSGRLGLTAVAGLFPVAAVLTAGRGAGYLCWAASGLLGLILLPNKEVPILYLVFLGLYPVVKERIESLRRRGVEWCLKLGYFNLALTLVWMILQKIVQIALPNWLGNSGLLLYGAGNLIFVIYDIGLSKLIALMRVRLRFRGGR